MNKYRNEQKQSVSHFICNVTLDICPWNATVQNMVMAYWDIRHRLSNAQC